MSDTPHSTRRNRLVDALLWLVVIACLPVIVGGIAMAPPEGFWRGLLGIDQPAEAAASPQFAAAGPTVSEDLGLPDAPAGARSLTKPIDQITLGDRVLGKNPEVSDADRLHVEEVEPATWRKLTLAMTKDDGSPLAIELLRPVSWLAEAGAEVGGEIYLEMAELGAEGFAKVLSIEPCPRIASGDGRVVTGVYIHERRELISLKIEGETEPIRVTTNHLFWSADREAFIEAGDLAQGEHVETLHGQVAIESLGPRGPPNVVEKVYNLEVNGEHVYRVSTAGVLVHNECAERFARVVQVTSWADKGVLPDLNPGRWVVKGGPTRINFWKTGLPGPKVSFKGQFPLVEFRASLVPFDNYVTKRIPASKIRWPSGIDKWRGLFGQRRIVE